MIVIRAWLSPTDSAVVAFENDEVDQAWNAFLDWQEDIDSVVWTYIPQKTVNQWSIGLINLEYPNLIKGE